MENVNDPPDSSEREYDLGQSDATCSSTGKKSKVWRMPSNEDLSELSHAVASLTTPSADISLSGEGVDVNPSNHHRANMDIALKQALNFKEETVRQAGFTNDQLEDMLHFTSSNVAEPSSHVDRHARRRPRPIPSTNSEQFLEFYSMESSDSDQSTASRQKRLMHAISQDDISTIRHLLYVDKVDPNFTESMKNPICHAAILGNIHVMKLLLDSGAHPDTPNASDLLWERHPIHISASRGHICAMQLLAQNDVDINQPDNDKRTPLHWAAMYGQVDMVKWLLTAGATVNYTQTDGFTPLHTATCLGNREVCRLLIEGGADLFLKDLDGWTPLHTAVCYGYLEIVTLLLDMGACPLVKTSMNEDTTLHLACTKGRWDIAELMLERGVPIESRNSHGFTPLLTAVFYNRVDLAFQLVKMGADVNAVNKAGTSSIYLSAVRCEVDLIKVLLLASCKVPRHLSALSLPLSQHSQALAEEMDYRSNSAQMLREHCLVVIRQSLAPDLQRKAHLLPLPEVIKQELVMNISTAVISVFP